MSTGAFSKIAGASTTGGGNNVRDGVYRLMVEKVHIQKGHAGECFIAEFRVMESAPNGSVNEQGQPIIPNAVGSSCSLVCNLTKFESAAGNAKAFVVNALAGLGITEDKITPEVMGWVCSEQNPLRGLLVIDETYRGVNKGRSNPANAGKPLTLNKWKPVAQDEAAVKQQRAWLESSPVKADTGASASAPPAAAAMFAPPAATAPAAAPAAASPPGFLSGFLNGGK